MIDRINWPAVLYAILSLTVIRMLPLFVCLIGTRTNVADKLFIGWFGPRGLATIVSQCAGSGGGRARSPGVAQRPTDDCGTALETAPVFTGRAPARPARRKAQPTLKRRASC